MQPSMESIKALREKTGCSMGDCLKALQVKECDAEAAFQWLKDGRRRLAELGDRDWYFRSRRD